MLLGLCRVRDAHEPLSRWPYPLVCVRDLDPLISRSMKLLPVLERRAARLVFELSRGVARGREPSRTPAGDLFIPGVWVDPELLLP
jgi:hypothetical protein